MRPWFLEADKRPQTVNVTLEIKAMLSVMNTLDEQLNYVALLRRFLHCPRHLPLQHQRWTLNLRWYGCHVQQYTHSNAMSNSRTISAHASQLLSRILSPPTTAAGGRRIVHKQQQFGIITRRRFAQAHHARLASPRLVSPTTQHNAQTAGDFHPH
ncbi:hypothetical protein E2C01_013396 [Portunus trituberculatus]|uniref:Uncharacterized protein n=1 Tax=Portunus trituberculatus TaxID=210409 RepID=A0A5B7DG51_PORTR|nr:hypothetical protein [Portunus trituberculatus]